MYCSDHETLSESVTRMASPVVKSHGQQEQFEGCCGSYGVQLGLGSGATHN
jgi:hypothetical protein